MMQEVRLLWLSFSTWPETERGVEVWQLARRNQPLTRGSRPGIWAGVTSLMLLPLKQRRRSLGSKTRLLSLILC